MEVRSIERSRFIVGMLLALALLLIVNLSASAPPDPPSAPVWPENGENIDNSTPTMRWENAPGADNYHIQIDNDSDYLTPNVDNDNVGSVLQYTVPDDNALPNGVYYWHVRAENVENGFGYGDWSDSWIFRVDNVAPAAPSLTSPDNNENTNDNTPNLDWGTVSDDSTPVLYYAAVSDNLEFPYENDNSGWSEYDNYQLTTELTDGTWYWHVRAKDNAGNISNHSDNWIFRVDKLMPELLSPDDGENTNDNTPTFSWENMVVADNYELQIDNQDNFQAPLIYDNDNITDNQHVLPADNALSDGPYYWRVRGYKNGDNSISSVRSFRVDNVAPAAPSLTSPDNNENTNDNTPNLDWGTVSDDSTPVLYYAAVSDNLEFPYENDNSGWISDDDYQLTSELAEGTWYWRVGAKDNAGNVGDNSQYSFRVDVTAPTISGITESSVGQTSATINWTTNELANSEVKYGTTTSYGTTQSDSSLDTSHSITLTNLSANTTYHYRVRSTDAANNAADWSSDQQFTTTPLIAPTSSVDNISPYWQMSTPFTITATASDNDGTVENVTLWYRYRENSGASWGSWDNFGVDNSSPWSWAFDAPDNDGLYEFYTRATDNDGQTEAAPSTADENAGFDTVLPTISSVQINGENTVTPSTSVVISIVAQDNFSGLDQMRFSNDNENWTDWEPFASENDYVLPAGDENKRVYVKVKDNAGNESAMVDNWIVLETGVYVESLGTIAENENTLADFGQFGLLVTGINLFAKDNIDNVEVEVKVVQEKPAEVSEAAPGTATYYFKAETNASADNLDNVEIRFDVAKSWLDNLGIGAADVKLWKLDNTDNTWQEVSTTIVGENASHVHFSATVPSLSWFAVTGEKPAAPIPYWAVGVGVAIIIVILIVLIWWWKKQSLSSAPSQGVGVAGES